MNRRPALRLLAGGAGGILAGPAALELFERLTWRRKFWPGADMSVPFSDLVSPLTARNVLWLDTYIRGEHWRDGVLVPLYPPRGGSIFGLMDGEPKRLREPIHGALHTEPQPLELVHIVVPGQHPA